MEPYYDPKRDRIVGCKPGTWQYAHESRHRWQYRTVKDLDEHIGRLHIRCYYGSIFSSIILTMVFGPKGVIIGVGVGMLPHVLLTAIMELDAYIMGTYQYLRDR